jgi:hypothetical protein
MPHRPPKNWFDRCTSEVAEGGSAVDPAAVCGATWQRKTAAEKALSTHLAEGKPMAAKKKKKKKGGKLHGAALAAWNRKHHPKHGKKKAAKKRPHKSTAKTAKKHHGLSLGAFLAGIRKTASGR